MGAYTLAEIADELEGHGFFDYADTLRSADQRQRVIDVVFDGPPGPESGRFVEVEDMDGRSLPVGEWVHRQDGYWALRLTARVASERIDRP